MYLNISRIQPSIHLHNCSLFPFVNIFIVKDMLCWFLKPPQTVLNLESKLSLLLYQFLHLNQVAFKLQFNSFLLQYFEFISFKISWKAGYDIPF